MIGNLLAHLPNPSGGLPPQRDNQRDAVGVVSSESSAKSVAEFHRKGLQRRRHRDLTAEKYMLHVDGEGDLQWADIYNGQKIVVPFSYNDMPLAQHNLLRPMVENMVAYHTTKQFRFVVDTKQDRESRQAGKVDQAFINYVATKQRWNALFAEAMFMASAYGYCPVHAYWRGEATDDTYEPLYPIDQVKALAEQLGVEPEMLQQMLPTRGFIDGWVGDPWDTIFNAGAKRNSVQRVTYGRVLPADLVRQGFQHVPEAEGLEGNTRMPSASRFQRTARKWLQTGLNVHGTPTIFAGETDEELIALVCEEVPPGILPDWKDGRLTVIALNGSASTDRAEGAGGYGRPVLLHEGPLPAKRFSFTRVYSHHRFDDVLGKPYVADLDDLQVIRNQLEVMSLEYLRRATKLQLITPPGAISDDTAGYEQDGQIEVDPSAPFMPNYLEYPFKQVNYLESKVDRVEATMFRIGGWQAASRGESNAGDSGKKVLALAQADDTVHGPTNRRFRESVEDFAELNWRLMKEYGDVPWILDITGDDFAHLAQPYIDRTQLSETPPTFKLVSGYGATMEAEGQQLLDLVTTSGADGEPLMTSRQFRKAWPDNSTYPEETNLEDLQEQRAKRINTEIRLAAKRVREEQGLEVDDLSHPWIDQAARQLLMEIDQRFPLLMADDPQVHLMVLSEISLDEEEDALARKASILRQDMLFMWIAQQQAAQQAQAGQPGQERPAAQGQPTPDVTSRLASPTGTPTSSAMAAAGQGRGLPEPAGVSNG